MKKERAELRGRKRESRSASEPASSEDTGARFPIRPLLVIAFAASCLLPLVVAICSRAAEPAPVTAMFWVKAAAVLLASLLPALLFHLLLKRIDPAIDACAREQATFLDAIPDRFAGLAIFGSAALGLFLELAVIRWQGTVFEFFAFYKNFSLLACFAGLGLGYAVATRNRIPLVLAPPLLAWQFALLVGLRHGMPDRRLESLQILPFSEQLNMGVRSASTLSEGIAGYSLLAVVFLLTALAFFPVGQACGRLLGRRTQLRAYGLNLLGSIAGVALMVALSFVWSPPVIWFALSFVGLLWLLVQRAAVLRAGICFSAAALVVLAWPVAPIWHKIYSPYQLLEVGRGGGGLMLIRAAGHYYQRVHDLHFNNANVERSFDLKRIRDYYDLPYKVHGRPQDVAVVGAGSGNDVSAAIRSGAAHIDAIEIDPAIPELGREGHPEYPYLQAPVRLVIDDARSYLRNTSRSYDLIVYGLLDSHTLLSHASSIRLDSFVYTVEGLRDARARLKPDGIVSLSFSVLSAHLGRKIYKMMEAAFDRPPICVAAGYDGSITFLGGERLNLTVHESLLLPSGFRDVSSEYATPTLEADVSTDDWPFFYMPMRAYPYSYLPMVALVLALTRVLGWCFVREKPTISQAEFFFLGAGFMLVETKGITEMGLTFGNTWQVIGWVIVGVLGMAFLANCVVAWIRVRRVWIPYLLLAASLLVGLAIAARGGFPPTFAGKLATAVVLTCPMFFSGIIFSTLLASTTQISSALAANLLGAMFGGLLEYNSMYFGFQFLYWMAVAAYLFAFAGRLQIPAVSRAVSAAE